MSENTYPAEPHILPQPRLWYGFAAAPIAWTIQGAMGVIVSAQFCPTGLPNWGILGQNGVRAAIGLVTLVLLAIAVSGIVVSYNNWHRLNGPREFAHAEGITREAFMSLGGILISSVFTVALVWAGIPIVMLEQCMRAR